MYAMFLIFRFCEDCKTTGMLISQEVLKLYSPFKGLQARLAMIYAFEVYLSCFTEGTTITFSVSTDFYCIGTVLS